MEHIIGIKTRSSYDRKQDFLSQRASGFLMQNYATLLESKSLTDVTFVVGNGENREEFSGLKVIFAVHSPVFARMFENDLKENQQNRMEIVDMEPQVLQQFMKFIYTGKLDALDQFDEELLIAADKVCILQGKSRFEVCWKGDFPCEMIKIIWGKLVN